jgi:hypothetical protein
MEKKSRFIFVVGILLGIVISGTGSTAALAGCKHSAGELNLTEIYAEIPEPLEGLMAFDSLDGPLTKNELERIKAYAREHIPDPVNNFTPSRNNYVYGAVGNAFETLARLYTVTKDKEILDILIRWTDCIIYSRNDLPGGEGRAIWNGEVAPVWPNEDNLYKVPDSEQGEIIGKIYNAALFIYQAPELHGQAVGNDPFGYGDTYAERADTYALRAEEALKGYLIPTFIHRETNEIRYPADPRFYDERTPGNMNLSDMGRVMMTNRQFMVAHAFQYAAEVYEYLGDTEFSAFCAAVTQKSLDSFENSIVIRRHYRCIFSWLTELFCKSGRIYVARWNYWPEKDSYVEDVGHGAFDMLAYFRILNFDRYHSLDNSIELVCKTILHKLHLGNGTFAANVAGEKGSPPEKQVRQNYLLMAVHDPEIMTLITEPYIISALRDVSNYGTALYLKAALYGVEAS